MKRFCVIRLTVIFLALFFLAWAAPTLAVSGAGSDRSDRMAGFDSEPGMDAIMVAQSDSEEEGVQATVMQIDGNRVTVRANRGVGTSSTVEVRDASSYKVGELIKLKGSSISKYTTSPEGFSLNPTGSGSGTSIKPKNPPTATPMPLPDPKDLPRR